MKKFPRLAVLSLFTALVSSASSLYVVGTGTFSSTDSADTYVVPGDTFSLTFVVASNPLLSSGSYTTTSFAVPVTAFSYKLNGATVTVPSPSGITFYTAVDGGGYEVDFGASGPEFLFGSAQLFTGSTSAPVFSSGTSTSQSFTYFDSKNVDGGTATVAVSPTPEPGSLLLTFCGGLVAIGLGLVRSYRVA